MAPSPTAADATNVTQNPTPPSDNDAISEVIVPSVPIPTQASVHPSPATAVCESQRDAENLNAENRILPAPAEETALPSRATADESISANPPVVHSETPFSARPVHTAADAVQRECGIGALRSYDAERDAMAAAACAYKPVDEHPTNRELVALENNGNVRASAPQSPETSTAAATVTQSVTGTTPTPQHQVTPQPQATPQPQPTPQQFPSIRRDTPYLSYAREAGLIEPNIASQPCHIEAVPTFYSAWAALAFQYTLTARGESESIRQPRDHMRLQETRLTGNQEWLVVPVNNMSHSYCIESDREHIRPDVARYRMMAMSGRAGAKEVWSLFCASRHWLLIPNKIQCDRTFCRDGFDCYYIHAMDKALSAEQETLPSECPLFQDYVLDRWWNVFARRGDFIFEEYLRRTVRVLAPYDSYDTVNYTAEDLQQTFAAVPLWMQSIELPSGVPMSMAPIAYYFHSELRRGGDERRYERAQRFLKLEYLGLFIAFWWNEMHYGGRQFVVQPQVMTILRRECFDLKIVSGVPTPDILIMMDGRRVRDPAYWNVFKTGITAIPDCNYVECEKGTGDYLPGMTGNKVVTAELKSKRVRLVLRQQHRGQVRKSSPMGLLRADLIRIAGLTQFVRKENWIQHDNIQVQDLLSKLFSRMIRHQEDVLEMKEQLRKVEFENEGLRAAIRDADEQDQRRRPALQVPFGSAPNPPRDPYLSAPPVPASLPHGLPNPYAYPSPPRYGGKRSYHEYEREQYRDAPMYDRRGNLRHRPNDWNGAPPNWAEYGNGEPAGSRYAGNGQRNPGQPQQGYYRSTR